MKLEKIRVINWMYFTDVSVSLSGNTAVAGLNGSGKTSLIDALQYVLIGSGSQTKFNSAQGESKRTLESYVRGHVGDENITYLREKGALSYLAIQIRNNEEKHIFGIAIEFTSSDKRAIVDRFYIENLDLDDMDFIADKKLKSRSDFFKQYRKSIERLQTARIYQSKISNVLGLTRETNYFKLVSNAIKLKSIRNVNDFIKDFLLEEDKIDIESAKELVVRIKQTQKQIEENKERFEVLEDINKHVIKYKNQTRTLANNETESNYLKYTYTNNKINLDNDKIKKDKEQISINNLDIGKLNVNKSDIVKRISDTIISRNEKHPDIDKLGNEVDTLKSELNFYAEQIKKYDEILIKNKNNLSKLEEFEKKDIDSLYRYRKTNETNKVNELLSNIKNQINTLELNLRDKRKDYKSSLFEYETLIEETEKEINSLEQGIHSYNKNVEKLIHILKEEFKKNFNEDVDVKPVVEFLELKENSEDVRNAIEGYLHTQRFHLVIDDRYFNDSVRIYKKYKDEVYGVKIVDGAKLKHVDINKNSLSSYIKSTNQIASRYIYKILNEVVLVDEVSELRNHKTAITKSCFLYKNNGVIKLDPERYRRPFIGRDAIKIKLNQEKENLKTYKIEYEKYNSLLKSIEMKIKLLDDVQLLNYNNKDLPYSYIRFNETEEEYKFKLKRFNDIKEDDSYMRLTEQIDELNKVKEKIDNKVTNINANNIVLEREIKTLKEEVKESLVKLEELKPKYLQIDSVIINRLKNKYFEIKITQLLLDEINKQVKEQESLLIRFKDILEQKMKDYVIDYFSHLTAEVKNIDSFIYEYEDLNKKQIAKTSELVDFKSQYEDLIIYGFLNEVESEISKVNNMIKQINYNLRNKKFGDDSYRIVVSPSKTQELAEIYKIVEKGELNRDLTNYNESDVSFNKVSDIISSYLDESNNKDPDIILDVRNFFEFDVLVSSGTITKSLMDMLDKQSGGETQVPFYILMGAAFEESTEKRKDNTLCIVLFDEAFSNMDTQRIDSMLTYFKDLNIQVIISIPGKYDSIVPHVETTLIAMREGNVGGVYDVNKISN